MIEWNNIDKKKRWAELKTISKAKLKSIMIKYESHPKQKSTNKDANFNYHLTELMKIKKTRSSPEIKRRDNYKCRICLSEEDLQVHHLIPKALGGEDNVFNLITLCRRCHVFIHHCNPMIKFGKIGLTHSQLTKKGLEKARSNSKVLGRRKVVPLRGGY